MWDSNSTYPSELLRESNEKVHSAPHALRAQKCYFLLSHSSQGGSCFMALLYPSLSLEKGFACRREPFDDFWKRKEGTCWTEDVLKTSGFFLWTLGILWDNLGTSKIRVAMVLPKPCFSILVPGITGGLPGPVCSTLPLALNVHYFEDVFQNDPLNEDVADLHRKLIGETHYQVIMIYLWNYHTVTCTLVYKKLSFGARQMARWWSIDTP